MNDCYIPLPVACLEIGRSQQTREVRRLWVKEMKRRNKKQAINKGPKQQRPKRRKNSLLRGHNKDRYHK